MLNLNYKEAIDEYGVEIADMMLEEEYNRYIRGLGYISNRKRRPTDVTLYVSFEDNWDYEKLY